MFIVAPFDGVKGIGLDKVPQNKYELLKLLNKEGNNKSFKLRRSWGYIEFDYDKWFNQSNVYTHELISNSAFEPYFVTHRNTPFYDESYVTWGFDKLEQVLDMTTMGHKMKVLPEAFMVHLCHEDLKGFKHWGNKFNPGARYHLKIGTSEKRRKEFPGLLFNTYRPQWLKNTSTTYHSCISYEPSQRLFRLRKSINKAQANTKTLKHLFIVLLIALAFLCMVLLQAHLSGRHPFKSN